MVLWWVVGGVVALGALALLGVTVLVIVDAVRSIEVEHPDDDVYPGP